MSDDEQDDIERIRNLVVESAAKSGRRPRAIHEAGHAVIALHLGLTLDSVSIEEREDSDGPKFGCARVRPISESFSPNELDEHSSRVIERVKKQIVMLLAAEISTKLILGRQGDPIAQHDQFDIRGLLREFPELQDSATIQELVTAATEAAMMRRDSKLPGTATCVTGADPRRSTSKRTRTAPRPQRRACRNGRRVPS